MLIHHVVLLNKIHSVYNIYNLPFNLNYAIDVDLFTVYNQITSLLEDTIH